MQRSTSPRLRQLHPGRRRGHQSSGAGQGPGTWVTVDLGPAQELNRVEMKARTIPGDYTRAYHVETSGDGVTRPAMARGQGNAGEMVIPLPPAAAVTFAVSEAK